MDVRTASRTTLDTWLKIVRLPIDAASRLLPNGDSGPRNPAMLFIDRADAAVRDAVGILLKDEQLREEAGRRRAAADERARGLELRAAAEAKKVEADARLVRRQENAEGQREEAERKAEQQKQQAERDKAEREQRAKQAAAEQMRSVEQAEQRKLAAAETKAKKERLKVLDTQADALDTEADALTATDEAQRLGKAASAAKATRKRSS